MQSLPHQLTGGGRGVDSSPQGFWPMQSMNYHKWSRQHINGTTDKNYLLSMMLHGLSNFRPLKKNHFYSSDNSTILGLGITIVCPSRKFCISQLSTGFWSIVVYWGNPLLIQCTPQYIYIYHFDIDSSTQIILYIYNIYYRCSLNQ